MSNNPHLFNFILRPIEDIVPWGGPGNYNLHWFGLTDGWYWMNVGGVELMRFSQAFINATPGRHWQHPYVEYHVDRLYDDLLTMLPGIIDPIPADIADHIRTFERENAFLRAGEEWAERFLWSLPGGAERTAAENEAMDRALTFGDHLDEWWRIGRRLSRGYADGLPDLAMWRENNTVHLRWRNDCRVDEETGLPVVDIADGEHVMSFETFMDEFRGFHERLMCQIAVRVEVARTSWPRPDVAINVPELIAAQEDRTGAFDRALAGSTENRMNWNAVRDAIVEAQRLHRNPEANPRRFPWQDRLRPRPQVMGGCATLVTNPDHQRHHEA